MALLTLNASMGYGGCGCYNWQDKYCVVGIFLYLHTATHCPPCAGMPILLTQPRVNNFTGIISSFHRFMAGNSMAELILAVAINCIDLLSKTQLTWLCHMTCHGALVISDKHRAITSSPSIMEQHKCSVTFLHSLILSLLTLNIYLPLATIYIYKMASLESTLKFPSLLYSIENKAVCH